MCDANEIQIVIRIRTQSITLRCVFDILAHILTQSLLAHDRLYIVYLIENANRLLFANLRATSCRETINTQQQLIDLSGAVFVAGNGQRSAARDTAIDVIPAAHLLARCSPAILASYVHLGCAQRLCSCTSLITVRPGGEINTIHSGCRSACV